MDRNNSAIRGPGKLLIIFVSICGLLFIIWAWKSTTSSKLFSILSNKRQALQRFKKLPKTGKNIMDKQRAKNISEAQKIRFIKVTGFKFCEILDNSIMDAMATINTQDGSVKVFELAQTDIVDIIEKKAMVLFEYITTHEESVNQADALKFSCFSSAEGSNQNANLSETRLTASFNRFNYFKNVFISESKHIVVRNKFKIAYLILLETGKGFDQLLHLIDILDDGHAILLIRACVTNVQGYENIKSHLAGRNKPRPNVYLSSNRFHLIPNHKNLLLSELSGYFELLHMAKWDYVINLTPNDYPLRRNSAIKRILDLHKGKSWIESWSDSSRFDTYFRFIYTSCYPALFVKE